MVKAIYMRVSTKEQEFLRQEYLLGNLGIKFDKVYEDKMSGKTKDRPALQQMMEELQEGDILYCESISRLGRDLRDLIDIVEYLVNKGVRVVIVKEGIDTTATTYKLLLSIFGAVAEMERQTIVERTTQSIEALKEIKEQTGEIKTKTGNWFGKPQKEVEDLPKDFVKYYKMMKQKQINKKEMASLLKVGRTTVFRWVALYEGTGKNYR